MVEHFLTSNFIEKLKKRIQILGQSDTIYKTNINYTPCPVLTRLIIIVTHHIQSYSPSVIKITNTLEAVIETLEIAFGCVTKNRKKRCSHANYRCYDKSFYLYDVQVHESDVISN